MIAARRRKLLILLLAAFLKSVASQAADHNAGTAEIDPTTLVVEETFSTSLFHSDNEISSSEGTTIPGISTTPLYTGIEIKSNEGTTISSYEDIDEFSCDTVVIEEVTAEQISPNTVKVSWTLNGTVLECVKFIEVSNGISTTSVSRESHSYTFKNLPPCYQSHFNVWMVDLNGTIGAPKSVEIPVFNATVSYPAELSAHIRWSFLPELQECLDSVTVSGENFEHTVAPSESMVSISTPKVCLSYRYEVKVNFKDDRTSLQSVEVQNPGQFNITIVVQNDVIRWSYPVKGLACVQSFVIKQEIALRGLADEGFVDVTSAGFPRDFSYSLLEPNDTCSTRIITIVPIHTSELVGSPSVMSYKFSDIGPVKNVIVDHAIQGKVIISWKKPALHGECVKEFRISFLNQSVTVASNETSAVFTDLDACKSYVFTIEVIDVEEVISSTVTENVTLREEAIGAVIGLQIFEIVSASQVWAKWQLPAESPYCIAAYTIQEWYYDVVSQRQQYKSSVVQQVDGTPALLSATDICSLSSLSVTPVSKTGLRGTTTILNLREAVQNLQIIPLSLNSVNVTWDPPPAVANCITHYLVFRKGLLEPIKNTTSLNVTINDLKVCKNYTIMVAAVNLHQLRHSQAESSLILEEHISAVQRAVEKDNIIQWEFPASGAGCVRQFLLTQTMDGSDDVRINATIDVTNLSKVDSTTFQYLRNPDFPCALRVTTTKITPVSNSGELGDPYDIVSPPPKPGPVSEVTIDTTEERQVTIRWLRPQVHPECISTYRVSYDDRNVTVDETFITIRNLHACVAYNFTVAPVDFSGEDGEGVTTNAVVKEDKMSGVQDLELREVDPRSLSAKWKPPENGTFCVAYYRVVAWINIEGQSEQFSNSTSDLHVTFGEVMACAQYSVQVIPVSKANNDGINEIADYVTKERVILRYHIEPVRMRNLMARSLELQTSLTSENNNLCELISARFTCRTDNVPDGEETKVIFGESPIRDPKGIYTGVVAPLDPFNEYNCTVRILNVAGWSDETALVVFTTDEDFPEQPRDLQLVGGNRSIELRWEAPLVKNGIITRYRVHIRSVGTRYPIPSYCPLDTEFNDTFDLPGGDDDSRATDWNDDELRYTIRYLGPYADYVVQLAAATKPGVGPYTEMVSVATLPEESEPVYEFTEFNVTLPEVDEPYNSSVYISWKLPCNLHGRLRSFTGQFIGYRAGLEHTLDWSRPVAHDEAIAEKYTFAEHRLEPEFLYNVSIMVFVENIDNHSEMRFLSFQSPAGIPEFKEDISWGSVNVMDAPNPTRSVMISLSDIIFDSSVGNILYVALLLSERHCQQDPSPKRNISSEWPIVRSWADVNNLQCTAQYQTTPKNWNPMEGRLLSGRHDEPLLYVIGSESCEVELEFCNGPLKPGTEYALIVRIFTQSGFSDSVIQIFETDSLIQLTVIITTVFVCLLLAFVLGLVVLWRTQKRLAALQSASRSPNDEPSDIPLKSFSGIYEELLQSNREKITKEYQAINYFSEQLVNETVTFFVAKENEKKNRYLGILPYDGNRVPLEFDDMVGDEDEEVNDYINASFIDGYKYQREYIATQGPKKETSFDYWRMIIQYDVESIVMLTQTVENDKIKCYQYFPRFNQQMTFRDVTVKCTQELNLMFYQKRLLTVTRGNVSRVVFHYHFLVWPDHGCPASPMDLMSFIKIVRSERKNLALPLVVHCSAGVGRTGTLIALDIILQRIQQEKKINIYDTVKQLRRQRVKMVQTSEQYAFLYQSCLEYTTRNSRKKPKTSNEEISTCPRNSQGSRSKVPNGGGRRPRINIKFPKYVHSGISNVKSYAPDDIESNT